MKKYITAPAELSIPAITPEEAQARSLRALSGPYRAGEHTMIEPVLADMRRSGIEAAVVRSQYGLEVWRSGIGFREVEK